MLVIPGEVRYLLSRLEQKGYEGYLVGGCVRDALLGLTPKDWDLCTSARPEEVKACFYDKKLVLSGSRHGTVGVVLDGHLYEITSYRTESGYTDGRHPDSVTFVRDLKEDLARRDFTVNAMAYHPEKGLIDPWKGRKDLVQRVLRCVGNPYLRFQEDALRILRGMRFTAAYGFHVEKRDSAGSYFLPGWFETDFQRTNTNRIVPLFDRKRHRKSFVCFLAGICCYFAGMRRRG